MSGCSCCCGRCILLYNIDDATWHDIVIFIRGVFKLYCFMLLLAAIDILTVPFDKTEDLVFAVVQMALYIPTTTALMYVSRKPSLKNTMYSMIAVSALLVYNATYAFFVGIKYKTLWALIYIVPVSIQMSTVYILFKMRRKLERLGCPLDYNKLEQGDESEVYHHAPLVTNPINPADRESMY